MTEALVYLFSSLLIFLLLTEAITFHLTVGQTAVLEIHFTVFALRLERARHSENIGKRGQAIRFRPRINAIIVFAQRVIRGSYIKINKLAVALPERSPSESALHQSYAFSLLCSLLAFLHSDAKKFTHGDITLSTSDNTKINAELDVRLTLSLLRLLLAITELLIKARRKKYVG